MIACQKARDMQEHACLFRTCKGMSCVHQRFSLELCIVVLIFWKSMRSNF
jgi:hypothetical protein